MPKPEFHVMTDTATIHSAGDAYLPGRALRVDAMQLLELATLLVLADRILINGFESPFVNRRTREIIAELERGGVEALTIRITQETQPQYAKCCTKGALRFEREYHRFEITGNTRMARPRLSREQVIQEKLVHRDLLRGDLSRDRVEPCSASDATRYMLGMDVVMRRMHPAIRRGWSKGKTDEVIVLSRMCLNQELAAAHCAAYTPAYSRLVHFERPPFWGLRRSTAMSEEVAFQRACDAMLGAPFIADALLITSKGEPRALIEEALRMRSLAVGLRRWLAEEAEARMKETINVAVLEQIFDESRKLVATLRRALGDERPVRWMDCFEFVLVCGGLPLLKLNGEKFAMWAQDRRGTGVIRVLAQAEKVRRLGGEEVPQHYRDFFRNSLN